nr:YicC/YloC family endoribonuclease [Paratissierella segnis]
MIYLIKSMTGYGMGEFSNEHFKFKVEIKAVNHRYSDISVKLPRHINYLEEIIKKNIKGRISRGKVDVYINLEYINESAVDVKIDTPLAKSYKEALSNLLIELNMDENIRLNNILSIPDVVRTERKELDQDMVWEVLSKALNLALDNIMIMKETEGKALRMDMLNKIDNIEGFVQKIEDRAPVVVLDYKAKLKERIKNLLEDNVPIDEDRLSNEVAFFADKSSIDEEIVRLYSHIKQFRSILDEDDSVGRKVDFLIQEFNREINTIGSKANDIVISKYVVDLKSELEKIREQIQNIE